ncbi:MAG: PQQ-binding-like beta-propeller repeat protein [Pirellulales bacterium]|nr:PQQ-binding-like beta-propeller repeat protein [Pirellulales bacterium]
MPLHTSYRRQRVESDLGPAFDHRQTVFTNCLRDGRRGALVAVATVAIVFSGFVATAQEMPQPPPFEEVCFGEFDDRQPYPAPAELERLLAQVAGQPYGISQTIRHLQTGDRRISFISGVFRLQTPWNAQTTLRLSLIDPGLFQLHFWRGRHGVTLRYCPAAVNTWGAYGTTRTDAQPQPSTFAVWALDAGRYRRAGLGTVEVRYCQGRLVLTRGDLPLLSVPLDGLPTEVYLQGEALVRGISVYPSTGGPPPPDPNPVVLQLPAPAEAAWETKLPEGTRFEKLPDGAVRLSADADTGAAQAGHRLAEPGVYEYRFELDKPEVGTGVFLGDRDGRQLARLAFYRDTTTGRTTFAYLGPNQQATELAFDFQRAMVPYAGERQWLRLTLGGGVMKCWTSGDGLHYSQAIWSPLAVKGAVGQVGLYCIATDAHRSIGLRSLEVRRLAALAALAPEAIQRRVGALADAATVAQWDDRVAQSQPADVAADVWRRACILRTLAGNPHGSLGAELIHGLLDDVLAEGSATKANLVEGDLTDDRVLQSRLQLLREAAVLTDSLDAQSAVPFRRHYEQLAMRLADAGHPDPVGVIASAVMRAPLWNFERQNAWPDRLLRHELLACLAEDRLGRVAALLDSTAYWTLPERLEGGRLPWGEEVRHLMDWAALQLDRKGPAAPPGEASALPPTWRDSLIRRVDKEAYNVLVEFRASLQDGAYREACQAISTSVDSRLLGVLPDMDDRRLLVSMPTAVTLAMRRTPALRRAMQEHFAELGALRLNKALGAGDVAAAEAVAVQFPGTPAAVEAHAWLGDRRLSAGRIAEAAGRYRQALQDAPETRREALSARLRLAGAMLGQRVGRPATAAVEIGDRQVTADEFERIVEELRQANSAGGPSGNAEPGSTDSMGHAPLLENCPPVCKLRSLGEIEGNGVQRPADASRQHRDWGARQVAAVVAGRQMIVHNGVELAAFDLTAGRRQWLRWQPASDEISRWPAVPMRPIVTKDRIFVRRWTFEGPGLACFERRDGRPIWSKKPGDYVACDPLLVGRDLFALTVAGDEGLKLSLSLAELDAWTGLLRRETLLAEFDDACEGRLACQAAAAEGKIVATAAGYLVCCDLSGRVSWIRQQIRVPPPSTRRGKTSTWTLRRHEPPRIREGRVYATQPDVWGIECLDLQTGAILWRKAVPEMSGLVRCAASRLIVETTTGVLAKDLASGETLWRHHAGPERLEALLCDEGVPIVYARADGGGRGQSARIALVCLDPGSGRVCGESVVDAAEHQRPGFGPLVVGDGRIWGLLAAADNPAHREIVELIRSTEKTDMPRP